MDDKEKELVVPIIREEAVADAVPVVTGGVRVTKRVESHDEIVEQALRKSHVEVKRVKTERVVNGPQPVRREGNTLIVPVVSEVLRVEKQWVVTEEIHLTELQAQETVQNKVTVNAERADVERIDSAGDVISSVDEGSTNPVGGSEPASILQRGEAIGGVPKRKMSVGARSMLKNRQRDKE